MTATAPCRVCRQDYEPSVNQWLKRDFLCKPCRKKQDHRYYLARKASGKPTSGSHSTLEVYRKWQAEYKDRPEVRARKRAYQAKRRQDPQERAKNAVRLQTRNAIARGELTRQPCEVCGEVTVDAHHDDYSQPLKVRWLCRYHHRQHHAQVARMAREQAA